VTRDDLGLFSFLQTTPFFISIVVALEKQGKDTLERFPLIYIRGKLFKGPFVSRPWKYSMFKGQFKGSKVQV
jgi:hypothetical protein